MIWILPFVQLFLSAASAQVNVTAFTETTVTLSWSGQNYQNFTVEYGIYNALNFSKEVSDSTVTLDNLGSGQLYLFKVQGYNNSGDAVFTPEAIYQATKPYPVSNVSISSASVTSLYFTWEDEDNFGISYDVAYTNLTTDTAAVIQSTNNTYINLTDLAAGHEYSVSVFSVANEIRSNGSQPIIDNTVPLAPEQISILPVNESSFYISWSPLDLSEQDSYKVSYKMVTDGADEIPVECGRVLTECTIMTTMGQPGDSYTLYVRSVKGHRTSDPKIIEGNTKPSSPTELKALNTTTTSLEVTWKGSEGSAVDVYQVFIKPQDAKQSIQNKTEVEVTAWFKGLQPGNTYQVTLVAMSGTASSEPLDKDFWTVPLAPSITTETTNVSIIVSWVVTAGQGDNFTIVAKDDNSSSKEVTSLGTAAQSSIPGLSPGHNYTVTVIAKAGNQQSPPSVLYGVITDPNPVQGLMILSTDTDSAMISWTPPTSDTLFDRYKLEVSDVTSGFPEYPPPNLTSYNVTGLKPGTHYILKLTTLSGNKESTESSIALTTIPPSVELVTLTSETTTVTVTWVISPEMNFHSINITLSNSSGIVETVIRSNSSDLVSSETFTNLAPGEMYLLSIITVLSDGTQGHPFETSAITKPDPIKEIRVNVTESYYIQIEWESVPQAHGYLVQIVNLTQPDVSRRNLTVTGHSANITNLLPGHNYMFIVQSFVNISGGEVYSTEVSRNLTTKPLPVVNLVLAASPEKITVSWGKPEGRVKEFFYRYRTVLRDPEALWVDNHTVDVTIDIPTPFPGEKYIIQVHSESGGERSDPMEKSVVIAPEPPKALRIRTEMTTINSLFLDLEVDGNISYAMGWNITYGSDRSPEREITVTDSFSNPIELSSLGSGETFTIVVFSVTVDNIRSSGTILANGTVQPDFNVTLSEESIDNSSLALRYTENSAVFDLYHFQLDSESPFTQLKTDERLVRFENLTAGQPYTIKAWVSSAGVDSRKEDFVFQTYPNKVKTTWDIQPTDIIVTFIKAEGKMDSYNISCHYGQSTCGVYSVNATDATKSVKFDGLLPFQDYSFTINTISAGKSVQENVSHQTSQTAPSVVRTVTSIVVAPNTVRVGWTVPEQPNGEITRYLIKYIGKKAGQSDDEKTTNLPTPETPLTNVTFPGLLAGYSYVFSVKAHTVTFGPAGKTNLTIPSYPPPFKESLKTEDILPVQQDFPSSNTVQLKFVNAFSDKGGEVITYTVIVSTDNSTEQKTPLLLPGWLTAKNDPAINAYQAVGNCSNFFAKNADCHSSTRQKRNAETSEFVYFTVGSEQGCDNSQETYCNGPLKADTDYYVALRAFTAGGPSDTPYSKKIRTAANVEKENNGPIIGGVVGSMLILAILVAVFVWWRYQRRKPNMYKKEAHEMHEDPPMKRNSSRRTRASRIVKLIDFPEHFQLMSADSDYRFAEEFEELREVGRDQSCNAAELPQNRAKNRFTNILPYDHSRVKLLPTDDEEGSDYINANYMPGYHSRREYIVTQGPLPSTRDDFWRMLWESNARSIIMLTRCVEKGREKCDHYWPQNAESMFYGDLQVAILNETKFPDWTVTEFRVSLGDNGRKIRHFHYTAWPDFGVPERPQSLVKFVKTVQSKLIGDGGPQMVHCSAGVGRSGTFIALDRLFQHIQLNDWVDPYSIVHEMRCQRVWMVQTEQQYICIHQCLLSVLQGLDEEPIYCNQAHENIGYEDCPSPPQPKLENDEGINVEII